MAEKKVTDTQGKGIEKPPVEEGVINSPVLHPALHDTQSPDPGKVKVTDAAGNEVWAWPVDAKEIAAVAGTKGVDLSEKIPEDATRPTIEDAIAVALPPTEETQALAENGEEDEGETGAAKSLSGKLPSTFPHHAHLEAGGVTTYAEVRKRIKAGTLTGIANIGEGRAAEIEKAVKE